MTQITNMGIRIGMLSASACVEKKPIPENSMAAFRSRRNSTSSSMVRVFATVSVSDILDADMVPDRKMVAEGVRTGVLLGVAFNESDSVSVPNTVSDLVPSSVKECSFVSEPVAISVADSITVGVGSGILLVDTKSDSDGVGRKLRVTVWLEGPVAESVAGSVPDAVSVAEGISSTDGVIVVLDAVEVCVGVGGGVIVVVTVEEFVAVCDGCSSVRDCVTDRDFELMMLEECVKVCDGVGGGVMVIVTVAVDCRVSDCERVGRERDALVVAVR